MVLTFFLVCFSIANPVSYENVEHLWVNDIKEYDPQIPFVLVGTCSDLRNNQKTLDTLRSKNQKPVTYEEGLMLARRIGAATYVECSALAQDNLNRVFSEAVSAILTRHRKAAGGHKSRRATGGTTSGGSGSCCVVL